MARSEEDRHIPVALAQAPQVRLLGTVGEGMLSGFHDQLASAEKDEGPIAVEITSTGGDAEIGRRLALEVKLARQRLKRRLICIGKTVVYSAGATVMGGFPREDRYLTRDAVLLIHCRKLEKTLKLAGPLKASRLRLDQVIAQIDMGLKLEQEGYAAFVEGSDVGIDEVAAKAETGWYIPAEEALARGLVAGIV